MPMKTSTKSSSVSWQLSPIVNARQKPLALDIVYAVDTVDTEEDILVVLVDVGMVVNTSIVRKKIMPLVRMEEDSMLVDNNRPPPLLLEPQDILHHHVLDAVVPVGVPPHVMVVGFRWPW